MGDKEKVLFEIGDFLGFCDLNGVEAIQTEQVQRLEELCEMCRNSHSGGDSLVPDAIWDRLMEILRQVNPDSELCKYIWEDSVEEYDDSDSIIKNNPMYSIQTIKSYDCAELDDYISRLPDVDSFDAHVSVKLNGHGIRLKFRYGEFFQARSRARSSAGRDITKQLKCVLETQGVDFLEDCEDFDLCEVRGEWVLPFENLERAKQFNPDIKSAFSGVASMGRDSASEEEWGLLRFVAYEFIAEGMTFQTKEEEYDFLQGMGFEVPMAWYIQDISKQFFIDELKNIVDDCEEAVKPDSDGENGYQYYTDGIVFTINDYSVFKSLGDDGGHYKYGNIALKVGYWKQDMYSGYIQTILWTNGKTKISPVAIVAEEKDVIEFEDFGDHMYIMDKKEISNYNKLGVVTASGNRVRRVPLYEPSNMVILDAYRGSILHFRYGGEAGVVPCFEDGTPLVDGRVQQILVDDNNTDEELEYSL